MSQSGDWDCSGIVVDPGRVASYASSTMSLQTGPFDFLDSWERLAERLAIPVEVLNKALEWSQNPYAYELRTTYVKGRARVLHIPLEPLRSILGIVSDMLQPFSLSLHESSRGYRPGGSTYLNALPHCGHIWIQKLDIKSFYESTTTEMVSKQFSDHGLPTSVAESLARLVTFRGSLALGPAPSPTIANLQLKQFDRDIAQHALDQGTVYTRYADDLTLSANHKFDLSEFVTTRLALDGYELNPDKSRIARKGQSIRVTGLSVDLPDRPRLPKHFKRNLRQEFYYALKFGFEEHALRRYSWNWIDSDDNPSKHVAYSYRHLLGKVRYALSIEPAWTKELLALYPTVLQRVPNEHHPSTRRREFMKTLADSIKTRTEPTASAYRSASTDH